MCRWERGRCLVCRCACMCVCQCWWEWNLCIQLEVQAPASGTFFSKPWNRKELGSVWLLSPISITESVHVCVSNWGYYAPHTLHRFQRFTHAPWIHLLSNQSIERWWIMPKTANFFAVVKHEQWVVWSSNKNVTVECMCVSTRETAVKKQKGGKGRQAKSRLIRGDAESGAAWCSILKEMY